MIFLPDFCVGWNFHTACIDFPQIFHRIHKIGKKRNFTTKIGKNLNFEKENDKTLTFENQIEKQIRYFMAFINSVRFWRKFGRSGTQEDWSVDRVDARTLNLMGGQENPKCLTWHAIHQADGP